MSTRNEGSPALAVYLDNLLLQLRLRDVPGERIGQILAEVETHVVDTGLDPVVAFGEPGEYAATYAAAAAPASAPTFGRLRGWLRHLGVAVVVAFGGVAIGEGAFHLTGSVDLTARLLGTWLATVAVGLVAVHLVFALLASDTAGSAKPRTFTSRYMVFGSLAMMAGFAVLLLIPPLLPTGPILVSVPGWVLLVAGLLAFFALLRHLRRDPLVDPRN
ncbi:MAG: hypothetical protein ACYDDU_12705 [Dermatophilaceae bacterium]